MAGHISPADMQKHARNYASALFQNWRTLHDLVTRHEETIRKRWLQKTMDERKAILLQAQPSIPRTHRSDIEALLAEDGPNPLSLRPTEFDSAQLNMTPHINLEDLSNPKSLLIFLNSRGRHPPDRFAHTELVHCPRNIWPDECDWGELDQCTMVFRGMTDAKIYGMVLQWRDKDAAQESITRGDGLHPYRGIQVLQIQDSTIRFLGECCLAILHDIPLPPNFGDIYPELPEPESLSGRSDCITVDQLALEAPYQVPMLLNFAYLRALASARVGALEDHIWALREDPGYFREVLDDHRNHRIEHIRDMKGRKHYRLRQPERVLLSYVIRDVVVDSYYELLRWHECHRRIVALELMEKECAARISPDADLPHEYFTAIRDLWFLLHTIMKAVHRDFQQGIMASPPMRRFWMMEPTAPGMAENSKTVYTYYIRKEEAEKDKVFLHLYRLTHKIWATPSSPLTGFGTELNELDRYMNREPTANRLISSYIARHLSSLSIVSTCVHQFRLYQPWAGRIQHSMEADKAEIARMYFSLTKDFYSILGDFFSSGALVQLADPSDSKFDYPVTQPRTRTNVKKMRTAEANLDRLWEEIDQYCAKLAGKPLPQLLNRDITQGRTIQRTPPWVEPPKIRRQKKESSTATADHIHHPLSVLDHDETTEVTGTFDKLSIVSKEKPKTRGAAALDPNTAPEADDAAAHNQDQTQAIDKQPEFRLNRRAYRVFKALFHSPNNADIPRDVPWTDFLHAMISTGFTAEKLHGSAWQFTPKDLDVERSIQFHEPHPESKLPFTWARRYGRRLARAYGWNGEMFKLA